jgi:tetratricopeptide (TPR) repeat protein
MNAIPPTHIAVRHTRLLLVKAGLTEDEADRLINRLTTELISGTLDGKSERLAFIEQELARLEDAQHRGSKGPGDLRNLIISIVGGVGGTYLTRAIDKLTNNTSSEILPPSSTLDREHAEIIRIEWAGSKLSCPAYESMMPALRHALQYHERQVGTIDKTTAVYLDGIGMFLDQQGRHCEAARSRRQAVKISQKLNGPDHESTAAALSNFGMCLFAQRRYRESDECLVKAFRILSARFGTNHITTACSMYNIYFSLYRQGRLLNLKMPHQFIQALPQIQQFGTGMIGLKTMVIALISLRDIFRQLAIELRYQ